MPQQSNAVAKWLIILTGVFALMEIGASLQMIFSPESLSDNVDLSAKGVNFLIYTWASRQLALGAILAYAAWKGSRAMITLSYVFMLIMFLGDLIIGIKFQNNMMMIGGIVMVLVSAFLLYFLNKRK